MVEVIKAVLRADKWTALPPGFGHVWMHPADRDVTILAHIGPIDPPPALSETLIFVCPLALKLENITPDRTVYLRTKVGSLPVRIDLALIGAALKQFGASPFGVSETGTAPHAPFTVTR